MCIVLALCIVHVCVCISVGVLLTVEGTRNIREESNMTRSMCVRLAGFGEGLERDVNITLDFRPEEFATEGNENSYVSSEMGR